MIVFNLVFISLFAILFLMPVFMVLAYLRRIFGNVNTSRYGGILYSCICGRILYSCRKTRDFTHASNIHLFLSLFIAFVFMFIPLGYEFSDENIIYLFVAAVMISFSWEIIPMIFRSLTSTPRKRNINTRGEGGWVSKLKKVFDVLIWVLFLVYIMYSLYRKDIIIDHGLHGVDSVMLLCGLEVSLIVIFKKFYDFGLIKEEVDYKAAFLGFLVYILPVLVGLHDRGNIFFYMGLWSFFIGMTVLLSLSFIKLKRYSITEKGFLINNTRYNEGEFVLFKFPVKEGEFDVFTPFNEIDSFRLDEDKGEIKLQKSKNQDILFKFNARDLKLVNSLLKEKCKC